ALVTKPIEELTLPDSAGCPAWLHPNQGGTGYYRFALPSAGYEALRSIATTLTAPERIALADSLRSGFGAGRIEPKDVAAAAAWLAASPERNVATRPTWFFERCQHVFLAEAEQAPMRALAKSIYRAALARVERVLAGLAPGSGEFPAEAWKKEPLDELRLYKK